MIPATGGGEVTLAPLDPALIAALRTLRVAPGQVQFSDHPADVLDAPEAGATPYAMLRGGVVVGMLRLDTAFAAHHPFAAHGIGLRSFIVGLAHQGTGVGTAATRALPALIAAHYPGTRTVWLTVNLRNPAARAVYLKGGFVDTGEHYLGGDAGPQHILRLDL
ncbi:Acetyltransferase (GNAT) family protein [Loktanella fryxellensis]|uniref:Acetyltransferase (GNAT) family protein n=1 Tax=Loktanella fryxellensis TaxID=245187 RepID=A0A1H8GHE4_9RHOB|nr:GNAT family N-acetyltransferase [Loktanella fryxellensis]SEN43581.1 Acetyltransferase (GNAT) family protein [Loktanella fryxellensis]